MASLHDSSHLSSDSHNPSGPPTLVGSAATLDGVYEAREAQVGSAAALDGVGDPERTAEDDGGGAQGARCRTGGGASAPPPEAYLNGKPSKNLQYTIGCLEVSTGHTTALSPPPPTPSPAPREHPPLERLAQPIGAPNAGGERGGARRGV